MKLKNKYFFGILLSFLFCGFFCFGFINNASAKEYWFDLVEVDININKDSSVDIKETITFRFSGEFSQVYREITLVDDRALERCRQDQSLQCGGFSFLEITSVKDQNGNVIPKNEINFSTVNSNNEDRYRVEWDFSPVKKYFSNQQFAFTVEYKVYGSIGIFDDYDLFYWDVIFSDRESSIAKANINITFPDNFIFNEEDLKVFGSGYSYSYRYEPILNLLEITTDNIPPKSDVTVMQKMQKGIVLEPATLEFSSNVYSPTVTINDKAIGDFNGNIFGIIPGNYAFTFSKWGHKDYTFEANFEQGEVKQIEVKLEQTPEYIILNFVSLVVNILGVLSFPVILFLIYRNYRLKGKDIDPAKVIVPEFNPPENIGPYLLGSLKDEKVDIIDITSSIIDLAYRGYLKIKEYKGKTIFGIESSSKSYELIKRKEFDDLNNIEKNILTSIFGNKERVTLDDLKFKFFKKIPKIEKSIYLDLVEKGYFSKRPDEVRSNYSIYASIMLVFSLLLILSTFLYPIFTAFGISLLIGSIILFAVSPHMPAKTKKGSELYAKVMGFKMYLETAERYRVQNLTPETFEKYLSYAIMFGIEQSWAEKFKDIYKTPPDWFEASSWNSFSAYIFVRHTIEFSSNSAQSFTITESMSGSGWSGNGGFLGGFSGGGGGGGGGGAS